MSKPKVCPHCGFRHWASFMEIPDFPKYCHRCKKDMSLSPDPDTETVYINGRMVERKRQK